MRSDVAALFVDPNGIYPTLVEHWWDAERDARTYAGPWPVVAHPPCQLWTNFAALNYKRWGGEHNRPGNDQACFASALSSVRRFGGVLEHPLGSKAWEVYGLARPRGLEHGWTSAGRDEWTCEVWQSTYGHKARKRTWLFYRGATRPPQPRRERVPGTHQCGWFDRIKPTLSKREASATPPEFAAWLIGLAAWSHAGAVAC